MRRKQGLRLNVLNKLVNVVVSLAANGKVYGKAGFKSASLSIQHEVTKKHKCSNTESAPALLYTML